MRRTTSLCMLSLAIVALAVSGCCGVGRRHCGCHDDGGPPPGDGQFGPPGTGLGIVEIYRNDTNPPRLIGYVTKDNSGVSYWLLNGSEMAPPLPTAGTKVTFQKLNDNDVNIDTWCATPKPGTSPAQTYGGTLSSPVIRRLDPTSSTSCP